MAKKEVNSTPKITNLPLPETDSPLVIDLPDGQKIVVGKLPAGSVIEIATWRGTGRPDSRTNRLMMGMNTKETATVPDPEVQAPKKTESRLGINSKKAKALGSSIIKVLSKGYRLFIEKIQTLKEKRSSTIKPRPTSALSEPRSNASSPDVDEWLAKIIEKSEKRREREEQNSTSKRPASKPAKPKSKKSR